MRKSDTKSRQTTADVQFHKKQSGCSLQTPLVTKCEVALLPKFTCFTTFAVSTIELEVSSSSFIGSEVSHLKYWCYTTSIYLLRLPVYCLQLTRKQQTRQYVLPVSLRYVYSNRIFRKFMVSTSLRTNQ